MNSTKVIYQTPNGGSAEGFIINGRTYKDQAGTQRIEYGSTVPTAGGTYLYTPQGGVETYTSIGSGLANAYANGRKELGGYRDAMNKSIDYATRKNLEAIRKQKEAAERQYALLNQQAYQSYLNSSNPYGAAEEQRARIGLANSGYSETSKMKVAGAYQAALDENQRQKLEYLNELESAYRDAVFQGNMAKANALAEYHQLVYQHGIDAAEAIANQKNRAYEAGINSLESQRKWGMEELMYRDSREDEMFNQALSMAKMGFSNADIAKRLNVSQVELNQMIARMFR